MCIAMRNLVGKTRSAGTVNRYDNLSIGCGFYLEGEPPEWYRLQGSGDGNFSVRRHLEPGLPRDVTVTCRFDGSPSMDYPSDAVSLQCDGSRGDLLLLGEDYAVPRVASPYAPPFVFELRVDDSPFGLDRFRYRLDPGSGRLSRTTSLASDVIVEAPYAHVMAWLHRPRALLGHLLHAGDDVRGSLGHMSLLEGLVSAVVTGRPHPRQAEQVVAAVESLNRLVSA